MGEGIDSHEERRIETSATKNITCPSHIRQKSQGRNLKTADYGRTYITLPLPNPLCPFTPPASAPFNPFPTPESTPTVPLNPSA